MAKKGPRRVFFSMVGAVTDGGRNRGDCTMTLTSGGYCTKNPRAYCGIRLTSTSSKVEPYIDVLLEIIIHGQSPKLLAQGLDGAAQDLLHRVIIRYSSDSLHHEVMVNAVVIFRIKQEMRRQRVRGGRVPSVP